MIFQEVQTGPVQLAYKRQWWCGHNHLMYLRNRAFSSRIAIIVDNIRLNSLFVFGKFSIFFPVTINFHLLWTPFRHVASFHRKLTSKQPDWYKFSSLQPPVLSVSNLQRASIAIPRAAPPRNDLPESIIKSKSARAPLCQTESKLQNPTQPRD